MTLLADLRNNLSKPRPIAVVAGTAILCILLGIVFLAFFRTSYGVLFSGLRARDAASIVSSLNQKKVPYKLADNGKTILVPENIVDQTRLSVMSEDLSLKGVVGFELFNKADMGLTEFSEKINYQRALQGELERTIMSLETIDSARVHLAFSEPAVFRADRIPPKASVTIAAQPGTTLSAGSVRGIRRLVAAAVPALDPMDVVVLDAAGHVISADSVPAPVSTPTPPAPMPKSGSDLANALTARARAALTSAGYGPEIRVRIAASPRMSATAGNIEDAPARPRLDILVIFQSVPDMHTREEVRKLVGAAAGADLSAGDTIMLTEALTEEKIAPPAPRAHTSPVNAPAVRAEPQTNRPDLGGLVRMAGLFAAILMFVTVVVLMVRRRNGIAPLSDKEREAFAVRLRTLLQEGSHDA